MVQSNWWKRRSECQIKNLKISLNNIFFLVNNNNNNDFLPALTQPMAKLEVNSTNKQIHIEAYILNCPMKTTWEWEISLHFMKIGKWTAMICSKLSIFQWLRCHGLTTRTCSGFLVQTNILEPSGCIPASLIGAPSSPQILSSNVIDSHRILFWIR